MGANHSEAAAPQLIPTHSLSSPLLTPCTPAKQPPKRCHRVIHGHTCSSHHPGLLLLFHFTRLFPAPGP